MNCPECNCDMIGIEASSRALELEDELLLIRLLVCEDEECRFVVIVDWRWQRAAQEATR